MKNKADLIKKEKKKKSQTQREPLRALLALSGGLIKSHRHRKTKSKKKKVTDDHDYTLISQLLIMGFIQPQK